MPVLFRPVNNFLGQVIGNASEGKYNTVNNWEPEYDSLCLASPANFLFWPGIGQGS